MPTIKDLKEHIKDMPDDEPVHYILWFKEDLEIENYHGKLCKLTLEQASSILEYLHHNHDCNHGTTWDTVDYAVDEEMSE